MINNIQIYGERCSGTNYLENLIKKNFDITITSKYGWKHFFGFNELNDNENTLFICIVRNPVDWFNSLYRERHHLPINFSNLNNFLNSEVISTRDNGTIIYEDKNLMNKNKYYKNLFELRHIKLKYLIDILPNLVKNYILIKYEDLINNYEKTMEKIKSFNLKLNENIVFPENHYLYKSTQNKFNNNIKKNNLDKNLILNNTNFYTYYEKKLNYI